MQLIDFIGKTFNLLVDQDRQLITDLFISSRASDNKDILIKYTYFNNENIYIPFDIKNRRNFVDILSINNNFGSPLIVAVEVLPFVKLTSH